MRAPPRPRPDSRPCAGRRPDDAPAARPCRGAAGASGGQRRVGSTRGVCGFLRARSRSNCTLLSACARRAAFLANRLHMRSVGCQSTRLLTLTHTHTQFRHSCMPHARYHTPPRGVVALRSLTPMRMQHVHGLRVHARILAREAESARDTRSSHRASRDLAFTMSRGGLLSAEIHSNGDQHRHPHSEVEVEALHACAPPSSNRASYRPPRP